MQQSESSEATYVFPERKINESKIECLIRRMSFQIADDFSYLYCIEKSVPYEIQNKLKKNSTLGQEVLIDKGSFGNVYLTEHQRQRKPCALKVHHNINDEELLFQTNEYAIQFKLGQINHKLFVSLIDKIYIKQTEINNYTTYAGLELGNFNLDSYLKQVKISESEFESIYYSILNGIITMHEHQFAHRDIKPQNILYVEGKGWVLGDFGCSIKYSNIEGKYKICGTKNYLPQNLRKLVKNNFCDQQNDLNLFLNDIYAFQMTMLQTFNPNLLINEVQEILDCQHPYHPLIDSLYNKSLDQLKSNQLTITKIPPKIIESTVSKALKNLKLLDNDEQMQFKNLVEYFKMVVFDENFRKNQKQRKTGLCKILAQLGKVIFKEYLIYIKMMYSMISNTKLDIDICAIQVNESTKHWQYQLIQWCLDFFGHFEKRYQNCIIYQKAKNKTSLSYKIEEVEMALILGKKTMALKILDGIQDQAYYSDDINYLKYYYYKAKLNNQWWEIEDQVILYFKHLHQSIYIRSQMQLEVYYLTADMNNKQSYWHDEKEYINYSTLDDSQKRLRFIEMWKQNDSENIWKIKQQEKVFEETENTSISIWIQEQKNKGHSNQNIIGKLNDLASQYQLTGNLDQAFQIYNKLFSLLKENCNYEHLKIELFGNFAQLLVEMGNYDAAYGLALKACENSKDDIFSSIRNYQLLWYIRVQMNGDDCLNIFKLLMSLYEQFKGKKIKLGLIKNVYYGLMIMLQRHQFTQFQSHLSLLESQNIEDEEYSLDYNYLLHNFRWNLYSFQRNFSSLINEFNYFLLNILKTKKHHFKQAPFQYIQHIAATGYLEEKVSEDEKNLHFSKYLQSFIIEGDLSMLDESKVWCSRQLALHQFKVAAEENFVLSEMGLRIEENFMQYYY